jgi:arylsulfatase A-like enzyme
LNTLNGSYQKANVIWILCDQLRADALSYRGDRNVNTPNIDNLARNGMRFDAAVAGAPWCCPFRGSLLTGQYPHQNGVYKTPSALDPAIPVITEPFKKAGYHTAWVGKWHLDGSNSCHHMIPPERRGGFDYWMGYENNNNQYETYVYGTGQEEPERLPGYETDSLTDIFISHLREHVGEKKGSQMGFNAGGADSEEYQPFFATLSVQPPHSPYVPPLDETGEGRYFKNPGDIQFRPNVPHSRRVREEAAMDLAGYYGMIENLDMNVGRIRKALKEMDVDRETYIIFFSDHGDCLGSHGQWEKSTPWEESVRIPFIIGTLGGREHMKTGRTDSLMNHVDIPATTLGLCGIEVPDWIKGYDYSEECISPERPEFSKDTEQDRLSEKEKPQSAYLQQIPRKFHRHTVNRAWRGVVTTDGWKYVCMPGHEWLLFDLNDDPFEMANLAYDTVFQKQKERCHELLKEWIEKTGDRFDLPDISL